MQLDYILLDVFTESPFAGNQLAVFTDGTQLSGEWMQRVANEMNLAETVFVIPTEDPFQPEIRIFTTSDEMPFAGHPTIGTAVCLAHLYHETTGIEQYKWVLKEKVGPIPVEVQLGASSAKASFNVAKLPEISASNLDRQMASELLGLAKDQVRSNPVIGSCGAPFTFIELASREALSAVRINSSLTELWFADDEWPAFYLFCRDQQQTDLIHARMFCQEVNVEEDPATGSAASALAGVITCLESAVEVQEFQIHQGVDMGRSSQIHLSVTVEQQQIVDVKVTGSAITVGRGQLMVDL